MIAPPASTTTLPGAAVRLRGVTRTFGAAKALDAVSLDIAAGSFCVLLGPSGCGKTTCLRIVAGLETASAGRVEIGGRDVTALPPAARGVAMVFQSYALFPHLSAAENIVFGLKARRVNGAERARRQERAADLLGIAKLLDRRPGQLSGGQQQRVALGRAIVAEAPVCLMDEPLSNLDAQLRAEMRREILALQRRLGITMLYVTHDQTEAMGMADQVVLLRAGRIEQDAPPAEMYARPASRFVAGFIGTPPMNLLATEARGGSLVPRGTDGPTLAPAPPGAPPIAGMRPEALRLAPAGIPAVVVSSEYLGADTVLSCTVGGQRVLARLPGLVALPPGSDVHLITDEPPHLFDAATGLRIERVHHVPYETIPPSSPEKEVSAMIRRRTLLGTAVASLAAPAIVRAQGPKALTFYYPIAVGGPIPAIIDGYCQDFTRETGITVTPVYAGNYGETLTKAVTAIRGGSGPHFAVLLAAEMHSVQDMDILVSLDEIGLDDEAKAWLAGFYPAFMANSHAAGRTWSVPFQRSTAIFYYNKAAFHEAGLDPDKFPTTWDSLAETARKLTRRDADGRVTRWGIKMASDFGNAQWTFGALAFQNDQRLMNEAGTETYFAAPKTIEAMTFWRGLAAEYKATPDGISAWPQLSPDFLAGNAAIIQHTTGNLTNVRKNAQFPFGVAGLAGKTGPRTVVGGGNLYFFRNANPDERAAALRFARFVSTPERAADWSIRTGYIATTPAAYETPALLEYVKQFPEANVARSYLPVATGELSTFENQRVYKTLTDNIQACLNGTKTPTQAMTDTQTDADRILAPYRKV